MKIRLQLSIGQHALDWPALLLTLALVVVVRESAVYLMAQFQHRELGNLVGLFGLLGFLLLFKMWRPLPRRMLDANTRIMKESALAFLPIAAGAGSMLQQLGAEAIPVLIIMIVSTLLPLWVYAQLAKRGLKT